MRPSVSAVCRVDRFPEHLAGVSAAVAAAQERAEIGQCARLFEPGVGAGEHVYGLTQVRLSDRHDRKHGLGARVKVATSPAARKSSSASPGRR